MPELPEVETIRKGLGSTIINQTIAAIDILLPKMFLGDKHNVIGGSILSVERRGKLLILRTSSGHSLLIHLKMTGQLLLVRRGEKTDLPTKSTKVVLYMQSGDRLFFNDYRTFGYAHVFPTDRLSEHPFLQRVGIEPLDNEFTLDYLRRMVARNSKSVIKGFLLDQTKIAGLGNIYTDEALFKAHILPTRKVGSLSDKEITKLHESIIAVLTTGVQLRGSSRTSYVDLRGEKGDFLAHANVYLREDQPCRICGEPIKKIKLVGRGTHYCLVCQH